MSISKHFCTDRNPYLHIALYPVRHLLTHWYHLSCLLKTFKLIFTSFSLQLWSYDSAIIFCCSLMNGIPAFHFIKKSVLRRLLLSFRYFTVFFHQYSFQYLLQGGQIFFNTHSFVLQHDSSHTHKRFFWPTLLSSNLLVVLPQYSYLLHLYAGQYNFVSRFLLISLFNHPLVAQSGIYQLHCSYQCNTY